MSRLVKISIVACCLLVLGLVTFCRTSESPAAPERDWKIWTDQAATPPVVGPDFQPAKSFAPLVKGLPPTVVNISTSIEDQSHRPYRPRPGRQDDIGGDHPGAHDVHGEDLHHEILFQDDAEKSAQDGREHKGFQHALSSRAGSVWIGGCPHRRRSAGRVVPESIPTGHPDQS